MAALSPYLTAAKLGRPKPSFTPQVADSERVQAYWTYEDIFNNIDEAFAALLRTGDDLLSRRYIPAARALIEATNRYLAKGLMWDASVPADVTLADDDRDLQISFINDIFKREEFNAKFSSLKRWFLIKGDGLLHISANPLKPEGMKIRITEITPEKYFPLYDAVDTDRVVGCYIVDMVGESSEQVAQRLEYRKILDPTMSAQYGTPVGGVFAKLGFYEPAGWDDRWPLSDQDLKPVDAPAFIPAGDALALLMAGGPLPAEIQAVPVYHFKNNRRGTMPFGTSELQGLESMLAGLTQNASDEDMAVALMGVGMYYTDSGAPIDEQGNAVDWIIAPASVLELDEGKSFNRVDGVNSVTPIQDHFNLLKAEARETSGTPDVAIGRVDVAVAESGVALAIQMNPVIGKNEEKEQEFKAKLDQLMYDLLNGWLPAYERMPITGLQLTSAFADPLPLNTDAIITNIALLVEKGVIDAEYGREMLTKKLGYVFPPDMTTRMQAAATAAVDAVGARMDAEALA